MTKKKINMSSSGLTRRSRSTPSMSSSGLTRRSRNKDFMCLLDSRIKSENDRKGETGRSMVEMLGVLAIVGVLSVGSIAGYTYAMNKYYANELLAGASERAVLVSAQLVAGKTPSLNEFNNTTAGGTFGAVEEFEDGGFGLKVSKVKDAVCQNILKAVDGTEVFIAKDDNAEVLNEMSESDCSGDDNSFLFVYADDMGAIDSIFDPETPTDEEKKEYFCYSAYKVIEGYNDSAVVTECHCQRFEGGDNGIYYGTKQEAIAALCEGKGYWCTSGAIYKVGNKFVANCNAICTNIGVYDSDDEAIAEMCDPIVGSLGTYYCSGKELMGPDFSFLCSETCYGYGYFENGNEAIAELCTSLKEYGCTGVGLYQYLSGDDGVSYRFITSCSECSFGGMYASDEEAIAEMCEYGSYGSSFSSSCGSSSCSDANLSGYVCSGIANGFYFDPGYGGSARTIEFSSCHCSMNVEEWKLYQFDSDEEAIDAMCHSLFMYTCNGKTIMKKDMPVTECAVSCTNASMYYSDAVAISAMCLSTEEYTCSGETIMKNGMPVSECAISCTNAGTYYSDDEAIREMCSDSYACSTACVTTGFYYCDENNLLGQKGNNEFSSWCNCKAGISKFKGQSYDSFIDAIEHMCGREDWFERNYGCDGNGYLRKPFAESLNCKCTPEAMAEKGIKLFDSDAEAIDAMCDLDVVGYYYCTNTGFEVVRKIGQNNIFVTNCDCRGGSPGNYDSDEEAIEALCP